ncbi:hypothetical protein [Zymobacter sp. IVIA_5232.4 C2]|uniref:hypothetical protein n=1 Tax=Zymobacter sp. IVIA_5232.4 C2 TaxID=3394855 RepID=UPI0039C3C367
MSDYTPALITGLCTLSAGPIFGVIKMSWDKVEEKLDFWKSLRIELEVTIKKIENDIVINSDENSSLMNGNAINHILNGSFNIIFESNIAKMGLLDRDQYELAVSLYRDIPVGVLDYKTNKQTVCDNNMIKNWFREHLENCKQLANSLNVSKWRLFLREIQL